MEESIVQRESNLSFVALPAAALRGRSPLGLLNGLATTLRGVRAALKLIDTLQPAAILGTGGYVCVPLFAAARMRKIPTMIYLPDVVPGLAVRLLSRIATRTAVNIADALPRLGLSAGVRAEVTGYPLRDELFRTERTAARAAFGCSDRPLVLVYGGSRGARSVNQAVGKLLPLLLATADVLHICGREGDRRFLEEAAAALPAELRARYTLVEYLEQQGDQTMSAALNAADVAICRSGASTLAELPAVGLPAVLVPYPYVHQDENADYLVRQGAAVKVDDAAMLGDGPPEQGPLARAVMHLINDHTLRRAMAAQSRSLAQPQAARRLAAALQQLAAGGPQ
jgi:UDP-N-acetylglucosamine--N-acetylmuramyl-(pentapeptide) pyrophosphoryl-undecaprenol N-acetylglucosamine transferase